MAAEVLSQRSGVGKWGHFDVLGAAEVVLKDVCGKLLQSMGCR